MSRSAWIMVGIWVGAIALGAGACQSFNSYCTEKMDCEDGNDDDIEACEVSQKAVADRASLYGCGSLFKAYFDCVESNASCEDFGGNDVYTLEDPKDCEEEELDYNNCIAK